MRDPTGLGLGFGSSGSVGWGGYQNPPPPSALRAPLPLTCLISRIWDRWPKLSKPPDGRIGCSSPLVSGYERLRVRGSNPPPAVWFLKARIDGSEKVGGSDPPPGPLSGSPLPCPAMQSSDERGGGPAPAETPAESAPAKLQDSGKWFFKVSNSWMGQKKPTERRRLGVQKPPTVPPSPRRGSPLLHGSRGQGPSWRRGRRWRASGGTSARWLGRSWARSARSSASGGGRGVGGHEGWVAWNGLDKKRSVGGEGLRLGLNPHVDLRAERSAQADEGMGHRLLQRGVEGGSGGGAVSG